jgi:hypothetical protein
MTHYEKAKSLYKYESDFFEVLEYCGKHGVIISNDDVFACGYKTYSDYILKKCYNKLDKPNTWFVYLLAGDPRSAFDLVEPLEFICFERFDKKFRLIEFDRIRTRYRR